MSSLIGALDLGAGSVKCLIAREDAPTQVLGAASRTRRWGPMGSPADGELSQRLIRLCIEGAAAAAGGAPEAFMVALAPADLETSLVRGQTHLKRRGVLQRESEAVLAAEAALAGAGARVAHLVAAPYASGFSVLSAEERDEGALVLDMGEETLGLAWFQGGAMVHAETLPQAGAFLTQSLAAVLNSNFAAAERVKRGLAEDERARIDAAALGDDGRLEAALVDRAQVVELLARRLAETFELVRLRLESADVPQELAIALTGGASLTLGARNVAERVLERRVRAAPPANMCGFPGGIVSPTFAAASGLLQLDNLSSHVTNANGASAFSLPSPLLGRTVGRAVAWFKENF